MVITRPGTQSEYHDIAQSEVAGVVEQFLGIGEDPEKFNAFLSRVAKKRARAKKREKDARAPSNMNQLFYLMALSELLQALFAVGLGMAAAQSPTPADQAHQMELQKEAMRERIRIISVPTLISPQPVRILQPPKGAKHLQFVAGRKRRE